MEQHKFDGRLVEIESEAQYVRHCMERWEYPATMEALQTLIRKAQNLHDILKMELND